MKCGGFRITYRGDERIFDTRLPIVGVVVLLVVLAFVPRVAGTYWLDVLNRIGIAIIGALGLNILVGFTGQISIGQAAFLAIGAYSTAILEARVGLPFYLAIPAAASLTSAFGLVFGIPSLRLRGLYLAIATLAAHFITTYGIVHWERMTNGVLGFNVPPAVLFGLPLDSDARIFYVIFALVVPATLFTKNLFRTRVGRAFIAIRDRDVAASVMGVSLFEYKLLAFVISSFYAGVAGGLMAHHSRILFPDAFSLLVAIDYLAMIIIGGLGSILGSIFGAVFMTLLPEMLKLGATAATGVYPQAFGLIASTRDIVFGFAVIVFLMYEPQGLAQIWQRIKSYWTLWPYAY
ncbi:MAG TPA: branched-chain amino acid ABC transporter permease [Candidatus Methylomirabilis sp.]|nr:branched-chain amino acid ABC transporter permease [Candidatus Methylomirabilis sp.]